MPNIYVFTCGDWSEILHECHLKMEEKKKQPKQNIKQREANNYNKTHYHQKINQLDYYDAHTRNVGKNAIFTMFSLSSSQCNGRKECLCVNRYEQKKTRFKHQDMS